VYFWDPKFPAFRVTLSQLQNCFAGYFREIFSRSILIYFFSLYFVVADVQQAFQGYDYTPAPIYFILIQLFQVLILVKLIPSRITGPVDVLQIFTAIFLTIPTLVTSFTNSERIGYFESFGSSFAVLFNQFILFWLGKFFLKTPPEFSEKSKESRIDLPLILIILLSTSAVIYILSSIQINDFFGFEEVYERRAEFMNMISKPEGLILGYALGILGGTLVPLILIWGLLRKSYLLVVYSFLLAIVVYLGAAQKWVIGTNILVLILFCIHRKNSSPATRSSSAFNGFSILIWVLIFLDPLFRSFRLVDLGIRRFLLDPSIMLQYYVAFSKDYTFRYWQDLTPVQWLLNMSPSSDSPAIVIGERYFYPPDRYYLLARSKMNATGGAISDSIAQAGILGLIITSCLLFFFFLFLGKLCTQIDSWLMFSVSALSTYIICEGTFHTSIFSRGLIIVPVILFFHSRQLYTSTKLRR
jgi:hypothetical protein